jgi:S-adenosylmethionine decarboxylase
MKIVNLTYPHDNLAPHVTRQRCFIEASGCKASMDDMNVLHYFMEHLCKKLDMTPMSAPIIQRVPVLQPLGNNSGDYGVSATQIWLESGVTVHTWPEYGFIDINIETCKPFDPGGAGELVALFFQTKDVQVTNIIM